MDPPIPGVHEYLVAIPGAVGQFDHPVGVALPQCAPLDSEGHGSGALPAVSPRVQGRHHGYFRTQSGVT
jgi:hypothetical protein